MRNKALVVGDAHLLLPFGLCGTGNSKTYLCVMHIQLPFSLLPALQLFLWLKSPIGCIFNEFFCLSLCSLLIICFLHCLLPYQTLTQLPALGASMVEMLVTTKTI